MIIDQHTINTLRTLAKQTAELEQYAGVEPAILLALLAGYEERDELATDYDTEHYHRLAVERDRDELAAHVVRLRNAMSEASNKHIAFAKRIMQGIDSTAMAAVDKADALLVRESYNVPADTSCLARHNATKQAEVLEEVRKEWHQPRNFPADLDWFVVRKIQTLRAQAEANQ